MEDGGKVGVAANVGTQEGEEKAAWLERVRAAWQAFYLPLRMEEMMAELHHRWPEVYLDEEDFFLAQIERNLKLAKKAESLAAAKARIMSRPRRVVRCGLVEKKRWRRARPEELVTRTRKAVRGTTLELGWEPPVHQPTVDSNTLNTVMENQARAMVNSTIQLVKLDMALAKLMEEILGEQGMERVAAGAAEEMEVQQQVLRTSSADEEEERQVKG